MTVIAHSALYMSRLELEGYKNCLCIGPQSFSCRPWLHVWQGKISNIILVNYFGVVLPHRVYR